MRIITMVAILAILNCILAINLINIDGQLECMRTAPEAACGQLVMEN